MSFLRNAFLTLTTAATMLYMGCTPSADPNIDYEQKLRSANKIVVEEMVINKGRDYKIFADGQRVATVSGKNIRFFESLVGDKFTLTTLDGKVIGSEQEEKRFLTFNRNARCEDAFENTTGYIGETISGKLSIKYIFHFLDANKQEVGRSDKLGKSLIGRHKINDNQGHEDYDIDKQFELFGDEYVITVKDLNSEIPLEHAILLTCIEDAIGDSN
jgi:hypothetical protein